mmetsp:Transcript_84351/g.187378  ORF Transcript_84351/g.187378 Transcript_84351/m.187378 type:complete len:86 (-) Transcript_84351:7-264(-)
MSAASSDSAVQSAGCQALAEMCRMGLEFRDPEERKQAKATIYVAQKNFASPPFWRLQDQAALALGLITLPGTEGARAASAGTTLC